MTAKDKIPPTTFRVKPLTKKRLKRAMWQIGKRANCWPKNQDDLFNKLMDIAGIPLVDDNGMPIEENKDQSEAPASTENDTPLE